MVDNTFDDDAQWLEAFVSEPQNEALRRRYIEWLVQHDDPLGNYLLECEHHSKLDLEDPERKAYRPTFTKPWMKEQAIVDWRYWWRNQIPDELWLEFSAGFPAIIQGMPNDLFDFFRSDAPVVNLVSGITLGSDMMNFKSPEFITACEALFKSARMTQISDIHLEGCPHIDGFVEALLESPYLEGLTSLQLDNSEVQLSIEDLQAAGGMVGSDRIESLIELVNAYSLKHLNLSRQNINAESLGQLLQAKGTKSLETLSLFWNLLDDSAVKYIAACPYLTNLRVLDLRRNRITGQGIQQIKDAKSLNSLRTLYLDTNPLGDEAWQVSFLPQAVPNLRILSLDNIGISLKGFCNFAVQNRFENLVCLSASQNSIDSKGLSYFVHSSPCYEQLTTLRLAMNRMDGMACVYLGQRPNSLRFLSLTLESTSYSQIETLLRGKSMRSLEKLILVRTPLASEERELLRQNFGPRIEFQ